MEKTPTDPRWMDYEDWRAQQAWFAQWPNIGPGYVWDSISGRWLPPDPPPARITPTYEQKYR